MEREEVVKLRQEAIELYAQKSVERAMVLFKQAAKLGDMLSMIHIALHLMAMTIIPEDGLLRDPETGGVLRSPFNLGLGPANDPKFREILPVAALGACLFQKSPYLCPNYRLTKI